MTGSHAMAFLLGQLIAYFLFLYAVWMFGRWLYRRLIGQRPKDGQATQGTKAQS